MNPRRNLQKRKSRRKRNERWEFRGGLEAWAERVALRDFYRAFKISRDNCIDETCFGKPPTIWWINELNPESWSELIYGRRDDADTFKPWGTSPCADLSNFRSPE